MKKQFFSVLCVCALTAAFIPSSFAAESNAKNIDFGFMEITEASKSRRGDKLVENKRVLNAADENGNKLYSGDVTDPSANIQEFGKDEELSLIEYFRLATENFQEEIDISSFNIEYDEANDVVDIRGGISYNEFYEMLVYCAPRSYYLISENGTFDYFYPYVENGVIKYIYPIYSYFKNDSFYDENLWINRSRLNDLQSALNENMAKFDAAIDEIKALVNEDASDFEKLIKYHDYIVMNYSYDWESYAMPFDERRNNTAFSMIMQKKGLCESMSILYNYLVMDMGLDTSFVTSYDTESGYASHTWNMVKLDKAECGADPGWYHVDITWDENATEYTLKDGTHVKNEGKTSFDSFLISDDTAWQSHSSDKVSYEKDCGAENTVLDKAVWRNSISQLAACNNMLYFIMNNNGKTELYRADASNSSEVLESFDGGWTVNGSYSGLAMMDDTIYYNTGNQICAYDTAGGTITKTDISLAENHQLFGLYQAGNHIRYCTAELIGDGTISPIIAYDTIDPECRISAPAISSGTVTIPIKSELNESFFVTVKDGDTYKTVAVDTNRDIRIDTVNESGIKVFVWDKAMKPYINTVEF